MRLFRIAVCIAFVAVTVLFGFLHIKDKITSDLSVPVITVDSELTEVSVNVTDEGLLEGVTAYDEKDKDLTDKIIIESVSKFTEYGVCKVTYAVCDSDNHVATATKKIKYTNYKSPQFYANDSLCFSDRQAIDLSGIIGVNDCIDGDISDNMILTTQNLTPREAGEYSVQATVTNGRGDTATLDIPIIIETKSVEAPDIKLSEYIVYTDINKRINTQKYITEVLDKNGEKIDADVRVKSSVNYSKAGVYTVDFYAGDGNGNEGHTFMTVVVGGGKNEQK